MNRKDIFYFTGKCLSLDENPDARKSIISSFKSDQIPIERFIKLCSHNYIIPAIFLKFKSHKLLDLFPEGLEQHFEEIYLLNEKRNYLILQQVKEISQKLKHHNILPVYLKGTANLLDNVYSEVGERMIGDIDFLVREKDYLKTAELLMELGYEDQSKHYVDVTELKHYPRLFRDRF